MVEEMRISTADSCDNLCEELADLLGCPAHIADRVQCLGQIDVGERRFLPKSLG